MLFGPDIEVYYERLKKKVGDEVFSGLQFIISSTHNHHVSLFYFDSNIF